MKSLDEAFAKVTSLVRETPESNEVKTSTDDKLKLYGLYKHATQGPCSGDNLPSILSVVPRAKYQAWLKYQTYTREEAMMEYIAFVASHDHWLGQEAKNVMHHLESSKSASTSNHAFENNQSALISDNYDLDGEDTEQLDVHLPAATGLGQAEKNETRVRDTKLPVAVSNTNQQKYSNQSGLKRTITTTDGLEPSLVSSYATTFLELLGCKPLIPRGQLDISYWDLIFALWQCVSSSIFNKIRQHQIFIDKISTQWSEAGGHVMVGLSVKSLLDLFLCVKDYPPGSEVIVTPPISVPGIMHILNYHNLSIVPVDIQSNQALGLNARDIEESITDRTVAIMIVHSFGMVWTSEEEMNQLRQLADKHGLDILEDCAECFTGLGKQAKESACYLGSPLADMRFFSFGTIKTATALGGGVAIARDEIVATNVERLQFVLYVAQTNSEYFWKIITAFVIKLISASPEIYATLAKICELLCLDFDAIVTRFLRGFRVPAGSILKTRATQETLTVEQRIQRHLITQIRKRPSPALLALLERRFGQARRHVQSVPSRLTRCRRMMTILQNQSSTFVTLVGPNPQLNSFWLFPIKCRDRDVVIRRLRKSGFDVTHGSSQLCCVSKYCAEPIRCPRAAALMADIIYLPVASQSLSDTEMCVLANELQNASSRENAEDSFASCPPKNCGSSRTTLGSIRLAFASVCVLVLALSTCMEPVNFFSPFFRFISGALIFSTFGFGWAATSLHILRGCAASFYLESSSSFAKYSCMINGPKSKRTVDSCNQLDVGATTESDILPHIEALKLPAKKSGAADIAERKVLLTGATGFVGSLLLRDLLRHRRTLRISGVVILCRNKRGASAKSRIAALLTQAMFSFLSSQEKSQLVDVVEGNVTQPDAGLSPLDIARICDDFSVSHVFHCAASVSFNQDLPEAAGANITSSLNLRSLAGRLKNKKAKLIHISTAFVHGDLSGTKDVPLSEELFSLGPYEATKIFKSMLGTQFYASLAMNALRFPNTYTFSKCICEHLLLDKSPVDVLIIRPSIVGPAVTSPLEGWAGEKPSTLVAAACLYMSNQWNLWSFGSQKVPCIPVDVLSRFIVAKSFSQDADDYAKSPGESTPSDDSFEQISPRSQCSSESEVGLGTMSSNIRTVRNVRIYNATWDTNTSQSASFSWLDYGVSVAQLGVILGYFNRVTVYIAAVVTAQLLPRMALTSETFETLHYLIVLAPVRALLSLCEFVGYCPSEFSKQSSFLDLPLLFFPFMNSSFHFRSEITSPKDFDGERYLFSCGLAAHRFIQSYRSRMLQSPKNSQTHLTQYSETNHNMSTFMVGGRCHNPGCSDIWWALSQPRGSYLFRLVGFCFIKVLRAVCSVVSVDVASFGQVIKAIESEKDKPLYLILAPTHRSFFDFLLLSYVFFALPELQIDIPFIAAADDFERLPVIGRIAPFLRAFYVKRGWGQADPSLLATLKSLKQNKLNEKGSCLEVFLEGKRSRDRRFVNPKTGFLRCLKETSGNHVILPLSISYEAIPEQKVLVDEVRSIGRGELNIAGMMEWLKHVVQGRVNIGRIHIEASDPVIMRNEKGVNFENLASQIQSKQQEMVCVSDYHIQATSKLLQIDQEVLERGMASLGCRFWPPIPVRGPYDNGRLEVPRDSSELCTIMLQLSHLLAPMCCSTRPKWSRWLNNGSVQVDLSIKSDPLIRPIVESILNLFDTADDVANRALDLLNASGFSNPKKDHLLQTARKLNNDTPLPILHAAVVMKLGSKQIEQSESCQPLSLYNQSLKILNSEETLGFWGFNDSGFVLRANKKGRYFVTMKGDRYSLCGKTLERLLPFIEAEMNVRLNPFQESMLICNEWWQSSPCNLDTTDIRLLQDRVANLSISSVDRARHGTGHSQEDVFALRGGRSIRIPDAVVWPSSETEVENIVDLAKQKQWCLIPFGGGTNVSNATRCPSQEVEPRPIISVDMTRMCRILWLNEEDGLAHVEAGITGRDLVSEMERRGFTIGHEPDSIEFSTLGGWIATKASGMKRSKYGNIEDIVKAVRVVSSGGLLWKGDENEDVVPGRVSEGLDLCSLMMGSEGCLGVITSAVIRVWPLPETKEYDSVLFPGLKQGIRFLREVTKVRQNAPASVRLLDNEHFRLGQALRPEASFLWGHVQKALMKFAFCWDETLDPKSIVCATICYEGSRDEVRAQKIIMKKLVTRHGGLLLGSGIGKSGYDLTFVIAYLRDFAMTYNILGESFETFVPWSKIENVIASTKKAIVNEHGLLNLPGLPFVGCRVTQLYHEGACLYFYFSLHFEGVENASEVFSEIEKAARREILRQGGSLSHHHGIGKVRHRFLNGRSSPAFDVAIASIKKGVDRENLFGAQNGPFACQVASPGTL